MSFGGPLESITATGCVNSFEARTICTAEVIGTARKVPMTPQRPAQTTTEMTTTRGERFSSRPRMRGSTTEPSEMFTAT